MDTIPKTLSTKTVYTNKFAEVKVDTLSLNGKTWEQVYFVKPQENAVGALPVDETGIYLVRQYRHPSHTFLWQLPMGMIDAGNDELKTIQEELAQEAGLSAERFTKIGMVIPEAGMSGQKLVVYVAKNLRRVPSHPETAEVGMQVRHFLFAEIKQMIAEGGISCGFTLSALMLLHNNFSRKLL
jgi:ADP-ribose pyrophosphatase